MVGSLLSGSIDLVRDLLYSKLFLLVGARRNQIFPVGPQTMRRFWYWFLLVAIYPLLAASVLAAEQPIASGREVYRRPSRNASDIEALSEFQRRWLNDQYEKQKLLIRKLIEESRRVGLERDAQEREASSLRKKLSLVERERTTIDLQNYGLKSRLADVLAELERAHVDRRSAEEKVRGLALKIVDLQVDLEDAEKLCGLYAQLSLALKRQIHHITKGATLIAHEE